MMKLALSAAAIAAAAIACTPSSARPGAPDAADSGTPQERACANVARVGCVRIEDEQLCASALVVRQIPPGVLECAAAATSKAGIESCSPYFVCAP